MERSSPRTRLEQQVRTAHLSLQEFVAGFHQASNAIGQNVHVSERTAKRWLAGQSELPRPLACRVLEHWWGQPVTALFGPPDPEALAPTATMTEQELFMAEAREARQHSVSAAQGIDPGALEQLHAEAARLARAYLSTPPLTLFGELTGLRTEVRNQLDHTRKPRQEAELYLVLGQVSGLLASVSTALGHLEAAEEQARAAYTYGRIIDHLSLCAWARALHTAVLVWAGRPRHAAGIAATALEVAPVGTAQARLHAVQARALAMLGARDEVTTAVHAAQDALDAAGDDLLLDEVGGELGFDRSRVALCASTAYVILGEPGNAEPAAQQALDLFTSCPWSVGETGARIDLGTARVQRGDLAGAEDALTPVFEFQTDRRTEALSRRLSGLGQVLGSPHYRRSTEAVRIGGAIEEFTATALPRTTRAAITAGGL